MSEEKTGGSAFPSEQTAYEPDYQFKARDKIPSPGMTLLDWFAGQCLTGWVATGPVGSPDSVAEQCYKYAAAMITERSRRGSEQGEKL